MSTSLSLHPDVERLQRERALLRQEFARAVVAARDLELVVRPYLLALFQTRLGAAELTRLTADLRYRRARRALELVQAALNRGEPPDRAAIEVRLAAELQGFHAKIEEQAAAIDGARQALAAVIAPADAAELRRLYTQLVLALHPDLHPDQPAADVERWHRLQRAYADGDLELLRALAAFLELVPDAADSLAELERDVAALRERLRAIETATAALEATQPFAMRAQLEDDAWVASRREALLAEADQLVSRAQALEEYAAQLTEGVRGGGSRAGTN